MSTTVAERPDPKSRRFRFSKILKGFVLVAVLWILVAWLGARWLVVSAALDRADAIVVLSGSKAYRERTAYAASLYRSGVAPIVVLTNDGEQGSWSSLQQRNPFYYQLATAELQNQGVPGEAIRLLPQMVQGTFDEAVGARGFAESTGSKSLLLVTSEYHSRRVLWTFEEVFAGSGIRLGLQSPKSPNGYNASWWVRPQGWKTIGAEYLKMVYYWFSVRNEVARAK